MSKNEVLDSSFPESPLWLEANGRVHEAEAILQKMARYNGVHTHGPLLYKVRIFGWYLLEIGYYTFQ